MVIVFSIQSDHFVKAVCIHCQREMPDMGDAHPLYLQFVRLVEGEDIVGRMKEAFMEHADQRIIAGPHHIGNLTGKAYFGNGGKIIYRKHKVIVCPLQFRRKCCFKLRIFIIRNKLPAEFRDTMSHQPKAPDNVRIIVCAPSVDQNVHRSPQHISDDNIHTDQKIRYSAGNPGAAFESRAEVIADVNTDRHRQRRKNGDGWEDETQVLI